MRICFVADNINPKAGLGRMVGSIAEELVAREHEVGFVVSKGESEYPLLEISFRYSIKSLLKNLVDLFRMRSFVKGYDVVVCFDVQPAGIIANMATLGRSDVVVVHTLATYSLFTPNKKIKNLLIKFVYKYSDRIFLINEFVRNKIIQSGSNFSFSNNVCYIPVGVDTSLFYKKEHPSFKYGSEYIISVGALKPRKGQLDSVKAFCKLKEDYPNLKYLLVGSKIDAPDYYNKIKELVENNNLENRVIFLEGISDEELIDLYSGAKFFVLTSTSTNTAIEGFGMVYIESALCGSTSIGTYNTGAEAAIVEEQTGLLAINDVPSIEIAMRKLLDNSDLRIKLAEHAHTRALTFDWQRVVDLYESELKKLVK